MADLVTHAAVAYLVKRGLGGAHVGTFVAGSYLPDLLCRVPALLMGMAFRAGLPVPAPLIYGWEPLHMPVGMVFSSFAIALLFRSDQRVAAFTNLLGGMVLHLALDLCQDHFGVGYAVLFPVWDGLFELGWVGSEASVVVAPMAALAAATMAWKWPRRGTADDLGT